MKSPFTNYHLSNQEFEKFSRLIFKHAGIHMNLTKKALVEGRLRKRLVVNNLDSYHDYYKFVKNKNNASEKQIFIDLLTTNETWFFREENHFKFVKQWLSAHNGSSPTSFWSAACSSGQEPYSIAMLLEEESTFDRPYDILATDISTDILNKAKRGVYFKQRIKGLSKYRMHQFMLKGVRNQSDYVAIVPEIKKKIDFKHFNLIDSPLPTQKFDFIFCRNVLIYFDIAQKIQVVNRLTQCLKTNGYLITGHSESLHNKFKHLKVVQPSVYQRVK